MPEPTAWQRLLLAACADAASAPLRICQALAAELDVSGAGVSVASPTGARAIVCSTDGPSARVEDLQFTLGVGPCIDAFGQGVGVLIPDLGEPVGLAVDRWTGFLSAAEQAGVRALFALPLRVGAVRIGALDLYRDEPGPLSPGDLRAAWQGAELIAWALLDDNPLKPGATEEVPWPAHSLQMQVHQATGMVQAQLDVPVREALLALRARAFTEGRPLADVADDVVSRRLRFAQEAPG